MKRGDLVAYACQVDNGEAVWQLTRIGDVATTWSCDEHLPDVLRDLQRDWEITQVAVKDLRKINEQYEIRRALDRIAEEAGS